MIVLLAPCNSTVVDLDSVRDLIQLLVPVDGQYLLRALDIAVRETESKAPSISKKVPRAKFPLSIWFSNLLRLERTFETGRCRGGSKANL